MDPLIKPAQIILTSGNCVRIGSPVVGIGPAPDFSLVFGEIEAVDSMGYLVSDFRCPRAYYLEATARDNQQKLIEEHMKSLVPAPAANPTPPARDQRPTASPFWMVVNVTDWQDNTFVHPHTMDGWTLPEAARPKHCHTTEGLAVEEMLRLQRVRPADRFVLLEATLTPEPRERIEYVCEPLPGGKRDVPF